MKITDDTLNRVEEVLEIKLYDWQRKFIKRECAINPVRKTGRTLAYIVRILLEHNGKVDRQQLFNYADERNTRYKIMFMRWAFYINEQLQAAGIYDEVNT